MFQKINKQINDPIIYFVIVPKYTIYKGANGRKYRKKEGTEALAS